MKSRDNHRVSFIMRYSDVSKYSFGVSINVSLHNDRFKEKPGLINVFNDILLNWVHSFPTNNE